MTRLLVLVLVGYLLYHFLRKKGLPEPTSSKGPEEEAHLDPVCGKYVSGDDAVVGRVEDKRIYFCSMGCLEKYRDSLEYTTSGKGKEEA